MAKNIYIKIANNIEDVNELTLFRKIILDYPSKLNVSQGPLKVQEGDRRRAGEMAMREEPVLLFLAFFKDSGRAPEPRKVDSLLSWKRLENEFSLEP